MSDPGVFDEVRSFPDPSAGRRFAALVGLDEAKVRLLKEARLVLDPSALDAWVKEFHGTTPAVVQRLQERPSLFLFEGDVGTGKTALAESLGDPIARDLGIPVTLYCLSLTARGTGAVGQMTALLSGAFSELRSVARGARDPKGVARQGLILLVDEADALAQSREAVQMHHEDRAGVNALIRGVDDLAQEGLPVLVIMCTNRLDAIDPAVRRRAAATFTFGRPNDEQRRSVLSDGLGELGLGDGAIESLVSATGPTRTRRYGFTFSDLTQRLLPSVLFDAFPDAPVTAQSALAVVEAMSPTPPFQAESARSPEV